MVLLSNARSLAIRFTVTGGPDVVSPPEGWALVDEVVWPGPEEHHAKTQREPRIAREVSSFPKYCLLRLHVTLLMPVRMPVAQCR